MTKDADIEFSLQNPNETFMNGRGSWTTYMIIVILFHLSLLSIPFISTPVAWTLTNTLHNIVLFFINIYIHYFLFHWVKGSPFITYDQGGSSELTCYEQLDQGADFTNTKKFLYAPSIILFILASHYTKFESDHFMINFASLCLALAPKIKLIFRKQEEHVN